MIHTFVLPMCVLALHAPPAEPPAPAGKPVIVRVATFNVEDLRTSDLVRPDIPRARRLAELIQRVRPTVILLNEIAYDQPGAPDVPADGAPGQNGRRFAELYLAEPQGADTQPLRMRAFMAPVNTGIASGFDLDNDGTVTSTIPTPTTPPSDGLPPAAPDAPGRAYGGDCWGFGTFPGQYGMALLVDERLTIDEANVRTFQMLPWDYMPGAAWPKDATSGAMWYSDAERSKVRLSSKSHWDVPVTLPNGAIIHFLCSHPTPPAFDGAEQRNKRRNHDEIRFWCDYVDGAPYIVDDRNIPGGLAVGEPFVILGDLNADENEGSAFRNPIQRLIASTHVIASPVPTATLRIDDLDPDDTARFKLRADYVLPSPPLEIVASGIWRDPPTGGVPPSDHFPVWVDIAVPAR